MQEHIFEHFNSEGQTDYLENLSVTFIDKTDIQNPEWRENHWIHTLTTVAPYDLNILSSVWIALFSFTRFLGHGMFKDKIYGHIIYLLRIIFFFIIHLLRRFLIKLSIEKRFENRPVEEGGDCPIIANSKTTAALETLKSLF